MEPYNPLRPLKYSREKCAEIFGPHADSRKAARLFQENHPLYVEIRADAVKHNLIGEPSYHVPTAKATDKVVSVEQTNALAEFSHEDCLRYYKPDPKNPSSDNLAKIMKEDPARYQRLKLSAQSRGILPSDGTGVTVVDRRHKSVAASKPKPEADGMFALDDSICDELGVERGRRVTNELFDKILTVTLPNARSFKAEREREAAEDAARAKAVEDASKVETN